MQCTHQSPTVNLKSIVLNSKDHDTIVGIPRSLPLSLKLWKRDFLYNIICGVCHCWSNTTLQKPQIDILKRETNEKEREATMEKSGIFGYSSLIFWHHESLHAKTSALSKWVAYLKMLHAIMVLNLTTSNIENRINQLHPLSIMTFDPTVSGIGLTKDEMAKAKDPPIRPRSDTVHSSDPKIHENNPNFHLVYCPMYLTLDKLGIWPLSHFNTLEILAWWSTFPQQRHWEQASRPWCLSLGFKISSLKPMKSCAMEMQLLGRMENELVGDERWEG